MNSHNSTGTRPFDGHGDNPSHPRGAQDSYRHPECTCGEGWTSSTCPIYTQHVQKSYRQQFDRINKHWRIRLDSHINPFTIESRYPKGSGVPYYLDLDRAGSSAAILDWIFQIRTLWFSHDDPEVVSTLLEAIDIVLKPQANFCSWGASGHLGKTVRNRSELRALIEKNWREFRDRAGLTTARKSNTLQAKAS